jgi:hypothetical protein
VSALRKPAGTLSQIQTEWHPSNSAAPACRDRLEEEALHHGEQPASGLDFLFAHRRFPGIGICRSRNFLFDLFGLFNFFIAALIIAFSHF